MMANLPDFELVTDWKSYLLQLKMGALQRIRRGRYPKGYSEAQERELVRLVEEAFACDRSGDATGSTLAIINAIRVRAYRLVAGSLSSFEKRSRGREKKKAEVSNRDKKIRAKFDELMKKPGQTRSAAKLTIAEMFDVEETTVRNALNRTTPRRGMRLLPGLSIESLYPSEVEEVLSIRDDEPGARNLNESPR